jgi:hypothetical protein
MRIILLLLCIAASLAAALSFSADILIYRLETRKDFEFSESKLDRIITVIWVIVAAVLWFFYIKPLNT